MLPQLAAAFAIAAFGGVHCAAMCGGFVGALQIHRPPGTGRLRFALCYHAGRVAGYAGAGALLGAIGGALFAARVLPVQIALLVVGGTFLALVGMALLGRGAWLRGLEPVGLALWRLLRPLAGRVLPPRSCPAALATGFVWGWIPCGMVYAALPLALVAGGPWSGAAVMAAFGAGTLPNLLAMDLGAKALARRARAAAGRAGGASRAWLSALAGAAVLLFAASDLAYAARLAGAQGRPVTWLAAVCHERR